MSGAIGQFRSGKNARVSVSGANLLQNEWDVTDRGDWQDTTNFEDSGEEQGLVGIEGLDYNVKGDWNAETNVYDDPPGIFPQDAFPDLQLYENISDNVFWDIPFSAIVSAQNGATVRGKVTFGWTGKAQPGWIRPTGDAG